MREEWKMISYLKRRLNELFIEDINEDCILVWNTAKKSHAVVQWNGENFDVYIYNSNGDELHSEFSLYNHKWTVANGEAIIDFITLRI